MVYHIYNCGDTINQQDKCVRIPWLIKSDGVLFEAPCYFRLEDCRRPRTDKIQQSLNYRIVG